MSGVPWPVAYTVVPKESEVMIRAAHGQIELSLGGYDDEYHAIYIRPENALRLIRALLGVVGMDDVHLHQQDGGVCYDAERPNDRATEHHDESGGNQPAASERPKDRTAAERQRRYRERKRHGGGVTEERNTVTDGSESPPTTE